MDIECDQQSGVAGSFVDYLMMLQIDVGDEYVVEAVSAIETLKSHLSSVLSIEFDLPHSWAYGYPVHRAVAAQNNPEWIWISPNIVPRGFVRSDHPRYAELKGSTAGKCLGLPEVPAHSCILSATDGVRSRVIDACTRSQFIVRPLREFLNGI